MNVVALILAHKYPIGLSALVPFFSSIDIDMMIHVDEKVNLAPFHEFNAPNVIFVKNRKRIFWGGFTMIEATIELFRAAINKKRYDFFIIISDDSLPIVSAQEFRKKIDLNIDYVSANAASAEFKLRYDNFYMFDSEATQPRWLPPSARTFSADALTRVGRLEALRRIGKKPIPTPFYGSQWMALTATSVEYIIDSWSKDDWLRESFEFSEVPDEGYFHTILSHNNCLFTQPLIHVEWTGNSPPRVFNNIEEIAKINFDGALFVRKIDMTFKELQYWTKFLLEATGRLPSNDEAVGE